MLRQLRPDNNLYLAQMLTYNKKVFLLPSLAPNDVLKYLFLQCFFEHQPKLCPKMGPKKDNLSHFAEHWLLKNRFGATPLLTKNWCVFNLYFQNPKHWCWTETHHKTRKKTKIRKGSWKRRENKNRKGWWKTNSNLICWCCFCMKKQNEGKNKERKTRKQKRAKKKEKKGRKKEENKRQTEKDRAREREREIERERERESEKGEGKKPKEKQREILTNKQKWPFLGRIQFFVLKTQRNQNKNKTHKKTQKNEEGLAPSEVALWATSPDS